MTIYIAGPMTGIKDFNRPTFNTVAAALRAAGFDVVNPVELCPPGMAWTDCMRRDIAALMECDSIALLPGWMNSKGARLERHIAVQLGMPVYDIECLTEELDICLEDMFADYACVYLDPVNAKYGCIQIMGS